MDVPFLKIGSKISIISKANVRYEGVFVEVDTVNLQIALSDVRFYGTESRPTEVYIAGQERTYPYVIFKSTDIKDIRVMNDPDEILVSPLPPVHVNGYANRDYPQSTLDFLRTFPLAHFDNSSNIMQSPKQNSPLERSFSTPRSIWTRCSQSPCSRGGRRVSPYMWRIPRVVDYVGRSGDPNELPMEANIENFVFEQDYDFEKNNKLFEDLLSGVKELNLTLDTAEEEKEIEEEKEDNEKKVIKNPKPQSQVEEVKVDEIPISNTNKGATPKKYGNYGSKSKIAPTAYNKAKSFFDTVSCASIYRSRNSNPNWREWNRETFGISMIRHQRRKRRSVGNSKQGSELDGIESDKGFDKVLTADEANCDIPSNENVTVQKIRFKAVIVTKHRGSKISSEDNDKINLDKNFKDSINGINTFDGNDEKYSLQNCKM